jgi:FKBP-type peptidyl-prolyl cis-trans isomerase SlyD|tara:strand:- start:1909 stop:2361 length:453 start_codon:yes stop_codon:yes gene_type:complete
MSVKKVYTLNYWLKDASGNVVDTSEGGQPMTFVEGSNQVIEGIQKAMVGREIGDLIEVTVPPQLAYGLHLPDLVSSMPISAFDGVDDILVGMKFQTNTGGDAKVVKVVEVKSDSVTVDANHPLAGLTLLFDLELLDIQTADKDDLISQKS